MDDRSAGQARAANICQDRTKNGRNTKHDLRRRRYRAAIVRRRTRIVAHLPRRAPGCRHMGNSGTLFAERSGARSRARALRGVESNRERELRSFEGKPARPRYDARRHGPVFRCGSGRCSDQSGGTIRARSTGGYERRPSLLLPRPSSDRGARSALCAGAMHDRAQMGRSSRCGECLLSRFREP